MNSNRMNSLRAKMTSMGLDGVMLISDSNRNYMSGFTGNESYSIITLNEAFFITDSRYTEQAQNQVNDYTIIENNSPFENFLGDFIKKLNIKALGFEENYLTYRDYMLYKDKVQCDLVPISNMVEDIRIIKDESEIKKHKKAAEIADNAFSHMVKFIKRGMTEKEISIELEFTMKKNGAKGLSFPSIVASGVRSSLPHGEPTDKIIKDGEFLTLDFGCIYEEYCSDMTRTICIGKPSEKMRRVYDTVLNAQLMALQKIKEGVKASDVDATARDIITKNGFGKNFGHGLGHGVGVQIHEAPRLNTTSNVILKEGMVVTDEPGIYIPSFGGVRIEDLVVVRKNGCDVLSMSPKNLIVI